MTEKFYKDIISYACADKHPTTYIENKYKDHKDIGIIFWNNLLNSSINATYSTSGEKHKSEIEEYCKERYEVEKEKELTNKLMQKKDEEISDLTKSNIKLQNEYLPHAIEQTSSWKKYYWIGIIATAVGTLGGAWIGLNHSNPQEQNKIQGEIIIHDTIYKIVHDTVYKSK